MSQPTNISPTVPPSKAQSSDIVTPPLILHTTASQPLKELNDEITSFKPLETVENLVVNWLCIDDVIGKGILWSST